MERLDQHLIRVESLPSREFAREEIQEGRVLVNGKVAMKPGYKVKATDEVSYLGEGRKYVSRGAAKLVGAIEAFGPTILHKRCIDIGASTGGFTQVLLAEGAEYVAAVDVGHGQLDEAIKIDPRVQSFEGLNFREIPEELLQELKDFDLLTMDVSFISVSLLRKSAQAVLRPKGEAIILIKPQFEAGRGALNKAGVVKDSNRHVEVLTKVISEYLQGGFACRGLIRSPIQGPDGNIEYLAYFEKTTDSCKPAEDPLSEALKINIKTVVSEAFTVFDPPHHR